MASINQVPSSNDNDQDLTTVVFRKWKKGCGSGIIALFPDIPWDQRQLLVASFEHVGQHGGADYLEVIGASKPATESEYVALKQELESAPYYYRLKVVSARSVAVEGASA
jgi:hypothetical protein